MNITIEQLIQAIEDATISIDVCTPSTDYYRRPGDTETSSISVVCPWRLVDALKELDE